MHTSNQFLSPLPMKAELIENQGAENDPSPEQTAILRSTHLLNSIKNFENK